jgi:N-acetylneuraminic acid mutarotase
VKVLMVPIARARIAVLLLAAAVVMIVSFRGAAAETPEVAPSGLKAGVHRAVAIETVERVRHRFRNGPDDAFGAAYPSAIWEKRADDIARQVNCLAERFHRHLNDAALQRELDRIRTSTHQPSRLETLFGALGHDPVAIKEGVIRPLVAKRWLREETAWDPEIQRQPRATARELALRFGTGQGWDDLDVDVIRIEYELAEGSAQPRFDDVAGVFRRQLSAVDFAVFADAWGGGAGGATVTEEEHRIRVERVDFISSEAIAITRGWVAKVAWDLWWEDNRRGYDADLGPRYAAHDRGLPIIRGRRGTRGNAAPFKLSSIDPLVGSWSTDSVPLDGRSQHVAVWTGSEMILFGGVLDETGRTPFRYDPVTDSWSTGSSIDAPIPRLDPSAVWTGTEMLVWGGDTGSPSISPGGRYDPVLDSWVRMALVGAPVDSLDRTTVWSGTEAIVWGGTPFCSAAYDPAADVWRPVSSTGAPTERSGHTAVWTGSEMLVWGGKRLDLQFAIGGGRYDPLTDGWTIIGTSGEPAARTAHAAAWTGTEMLVWGGLSSQGWVNTGSRFRPLSNSWLPMASVNAPSNREEFSAVFSGDRLIVWGGFESGSSGSTPLDTGGRYDSAADSWSATPIENAPVARYGHSAVWSGAEMIVWGGINGGLLATGGRYSPSAGDWSEMVSGGDPSPRIHHTATWTGAEMLVFGGEYELQAFDDGAVYDPVLDAWEPTPTANTPYARSYHNDVWTGSEVVIWGGVKYTTYGEQFTNTGRRFDPVVREWSVMQNTAAPSPRAEAVAIWVGPYGMFVWGGRDASSYPVTAGLYFPHLNDWMDTGAPSSSTGRAGATVVWTGREAMAWGGTRGSAVRDDGIRYDPIISSWATIASSSTAGDRWGHTAEWTEMEMVVFGGSASMSSGYEEPAAFNPTPGTWRSLNPPGTLEYRRDHSSVWTGDEMVVWGGYRSTNLNTGLRWNAASDTWRELTTDGAPVARVYHTAVWTGNQMIVWGGSAGTGVAIWSPITKPVITGPVSMCTGESATLEVAEGYDSYLWWPDGQTTRQITVSPVLSTRYRVDVTAGSLSTSAEHDFVVGADMDGNGQINGVDAELLVDYVYGGQTANCPDVDGNGVHDSGDVSAWVDLATREW